MGTPLLKSDGPGAHYIAGYLDAMMGTPSRVIDIRSEDRVVYCAGFIDGWKARRDARVKAGRLDDGDDAAVSRPALNWTCPGSPLLRHETVKKTGQRPFCRYCGASE